MMNYFLSFLLFLFAFLTNNFFIGSEDAFVENLQAILLLTTILIHLSCKKLFLELSNIYFFYLRLFGFIFLFYEEISFLTKNLSPLFNSLNYQQEVNFHNLDISRKVLFSFKFQFMNQSISITLSLFLILLLLAIQSGSFLPCLKTFRYLFLEKNFAIFSYAFFLNIFLSVLFRSFFNNSLIYIIHIEYCELFLYILLFLDVIQKKRLMKKKLCNF